MATVPRKKTKLEAIGQHNSFLEYKHLFLAEINGPRTKRIPDYILNEVTRLYLHTSHLKFYN